MQALFFKLFSGGLWFFRDRSPYKCYGKAFLLVGIYSLLPLTFCFNQSFSSELQNYNEENGLSAYANFIHKDSRGLIWIGTQFGLYQFDGRTFVHYDEKDGFPFRQVMEIYEDSEGWFWLHRTCIGKPNCEPDLFFFHPLTKAILTFEERFGDTLGINTNQIIGIAQDTANIYFTADRKLFLWSLEKGLQQINIQGLNTTPLLLTKINEKVFGGILPGRPAVMNKNPKLLYLSFDIKGNILQGPLEMPFEVEHRDLFKIRSRAFGFKKLRKENLELSFSDNGSILIDTLAFHLPKTSHSSNSQLGNEQFYVTENGTLRHSFITGNKIENIFLENTSTTDNSFASKKDQIYWVKGGHPKRTDLGYHQFFFYPEPIRHSLYDWQTHSFWSAGPEGIEVKHFKNQAFSNILPAFNKPFDLGVGAIELDAGRWLLGFQNHVILYTPPDKVQKLFNTGDSAAFHKESGDSIIWITDIGSDLIRFNSIDLSSQIIQLPFPSRAKDIFQTDNQLWMSFEAGNIRYFIEQDSFAKLPTSNQSKAIKGITHFFKKYKEGYLWLGTNAGLYLVSEQKGVITQFDSLQTGSNYLPAMEFYHMSKSSLGGYWLASTNGLIHWQVPHELTNELQNISSTDDNLTSWQLINTEKGLSTNEILAAYEDDYNHVWMPTPHGLIQYHIPSGLSITYGKEDGLSHNGFQEYAHYKAADGTLIFGGYSGFSSFHPQDFKETAFEAYNPLIITEYEQYVGAQEAIIDRLAILQKEKQIILQPGDKFFNIRVALQDYREADKHRFAYKIEGFQEDWLEDGSNLIRISGLPYGNYSLKIKGRLHNGLFAQPELVLPIDVIAPFYHRTSFQIGMALVALVLIFLFIKWRTQWLLNRQEELEATIKSRTQKIEQQAEKLQELDQLKSRFFANVTHELQTPLTLMLGPIDAALKSKDLTTSNTDFLKLAKRNGKKLQELIHDILSLTKLEKGKLILSPQPVALYPFFNRIMASFETIATLEGVLLVYQYHAQKELQVLIDKAQVERILNNLLSNAVKFTPSGGQIAIKLIDNTETIRIKIKDTGPGIPTADLALIFDRYYQSQYGSASNAGGTGIGLALCKELTQLMKGKIWAESEFGKGSTFFFEFPLRKVLGNPLSFPLDPIIASTIQAPIISTNTDKEDAPLILLVEDNPDLRLYLQMILSPHYQLEFAENGQVAIEILHSRKENGQLPQLIISDWMMPIMDGAQLISYLKEDRIYQSIPVIMLTARSAQSDKLKVLRIGVDDYISKPFEVEELLVRIQKLLHNYQNCIY